MIAVIPSPPPPSQDSRLCLRTFLVHGPRFYTEPNGSYITNDMHARRAALDMQGDGSAFPLPQPALPPLANISQWLKGYEPGFNCSWAINSPPDANITIVIQ